MSCEIYLSVLILEKLILNSLTRFILTMKLNTRIHQREVLCLSFREEKNIFYTEELKHLAKISAIQNRSHI